MATISVSGAAHRLLTPERGTARIAVRFEGASREEVAGPAAALHARLVADARRFVREEAASEWSADQVWVSTSERYRGERKEPVRVTVGTASVRVTFVDLQALSRWLGELAEVEGAEVHGVEWSISDQHRRAVEGEMRTEAVLDALERARAYAAALGLDTVELLGVYEPGLRRGEEPGMAVTAGYSRMAAAGGGSSAEFELRPQDLEVGAEVSADFTAS